MYLNSKFLAYIGVLFWVNSVTFYDFGRKIDSFGVNFIVFEAFGSLQKCSLKMKFQGENDSHFLRKVRYNRCILHT